MLCYDLVLAIPGAFISCAVAGARWCSERCALSNKRVLRGVCTLKQLDVLRSDRTPLDERLEIENLIPALAAVKDDLDGLQQLVGLYVRISNISSSVPNPPGKMISALARYANQNFRMKK